MLAGKAASKSGIVASRQSKSPELWLWLGIKDALSTGTGLIGMSWKTVFNKVSKSSAFKGKRSQHQLALSDDRVVQLSAQQKRKKLACALSQMKCAGQSHDVKAW